MLVNFGGKINLFVTDADVVTDMLVTKNAQIDKSGAFEGCFNMLFGKSFLFSKSDEIWKQKRTLSTKIALFTCLTS